MTKKRCLSFLLADTKMLFMYIDYLSFNLNGHTELKTLKYITMENMYQFLTTLLCNLINPLVLFIHVVVVCHW